MYRHGKSFPGSSDQESSSHNIFQFWFHDSVNILNTMVSNISTEAKYEPFDADLRSEIQISNPKYTR